MLKRLIELFAPESNGLQSVDLWRIRTVLGFIIIILGMTILMWLSVFMELIEDSFPLAPTIFLLGILLWYFKKTGNIFVVMNVFIGAVVVANIYNIYLTGGIYSYNTRWYLIPILLAFLILRFKNGMFWLVVCMGIITYFYAIDSPEFYSDKLKLVSQDYFIDNIFFFMLTCPLMYLFYVVQRQLNTELNSKNTLLEGQKLALEKQSQQLSELSKRLKESNENLEIYAHATAHDLKQPVRTIEALAKLVKEDFDHGKVSPRTSKSLEFVVTASRKLSNMIDGLLSLAKADHEREDAWEEFDPNTAVSEIKAELAAQIGASNFLLEIKELPVLAGNPLQLKRVFQNLISNALKFRRDEEGAFLEISSFEKSDHHLFRFRDNGVGIREEEVDLVFQAFGQTSSVAQNGQEGIGFGLAICRKIVIEHGGHIWVESNKGEGVTFYFTIPKDQKMAYSVAS